MKTKVRRKCNKFSLQLMIDEIEHNMNALDYLFSKDSY